MFVSGNIMNSSLFELVLFDDTLPNLSQDRWRLCLEEDMKIRIGSS